MNLGSAGRIRARGTSNGPQDESGAHRKNIGPAGFSRTPRNESGPTGRVTLSQPVTLRGQLESGKEGRGPGKSFGAFFGAPALMGWPQTAVQNLTP